MLDPKYFEQFTKNLNNPQAFVEQVSQQQKLWFDQWQHLAQNTWSQVPQKSSQYVQEQSKLVQDLQKKVTDLVKVNPSDWQGVFKAVQEYQQTVFNTNLQAFNKGLEEFNQNAVKGKK